MDKRQIQKKLNIFTQRAKKLFKPKQIMLFGSYAAGKANKYSDVDIVVIAETFKSIPFEKRLDALYPITQDLYPDFHVFGFTPHEYKKINVLSSVSEVKKNGIPLIL